MSDFRPQPASEPCEEQPDPRTIKKPRAVPSPEPGTPDFNRSEPAPF